MASAPSGALKRILRIDIPKIKAPLSIPSARGIPPSAACTVAFGVNANIENNRSLKVILVFKKHR